jgi:phosphoglycerol transferase MdoB-like AlkP superfamily enzyme
MNMEKNWTTPARIRGAMVTSFRRLPRTIRLVLMIIGIQVVVATVFRIAFWFVFRPTGGDVPVADVALAWYLGFKFDLRLALLICLPLLVLFWIPPLNPIRSKIARHMWLGYFVAIESLILLMYFVDFGHYDYLGTRLSAGALEHVQPVGIAARMLWETYPIVWGLLGLGVLSAAYGMLIKRTAFGELWIADGPLHKWGKRALIATFVGFYLFGIYGKWSWYPMRWSDAHFSTNGFVAALAGNPVLFFMDTFPHRAKPYRKDKVREYYDLIASYLKPDQVAREALSFARYVSPSSALPGKPNLVLIHMESFAGFKVGILGNKLNPTPAFDAIARKSVLFTNFFVPRGSTARSIFATLTGIPDLNPVHSASRNPRVVNQHTIINALADYEKFYFIGGSATWGNIRGLMAHNIPGLNIYEEGDYQAPRPDAWGVSDLTLFEKSNSVLAAQRKPFFAFIQTAGNHRPYTIPDDRKGFEPVQLDEETLTRNGFESLAAYNGIRLLDYSLDYFFQLARKQPYFDNTIFVMYGDHGVHAPTQIPWEQLLLTQRHIPLAIYAPRFIKQGRKIDTVASVVDILPTCFSLMGVPYLNTGLGRDLLMPRSADQHFAYVPHGVLTDEFFLRTDPRGEAHLHRYRSETPTVDVKDRFPEETVRLRRLYAALTETSKYLMYNNPPRPHQPVQTAAKTGTR